MARLLRAETTSFRCRRSTFVRSIADRRSVRMRGKGQASFLDNGERCRLCNSVISVFRRIPRQNSAERSKDDNFFTRRAISLFRFGDTVLFDEQNRRELGEGFIFFFFHQLDGSRLDRRRQKYRMENVNGEDRSSAQPRAIQLNQEYFSGRYCHEEFRFFLAPMYTNTDRAAQCYGRVEESPNETNLIRSSTRPTRRSIARFSSISIDDSDYESDAQRL